MISKSLLIALGAFFIGMSSAHAQDDKVGAAVDVVRNLCLVGSEYNIEADATGNIRILSTKPSGEGSLSFNIRSSEGNPIDATSDLRIIADREVRECTAKHIGRIIDAIFSENPPSTSSVEQKNYRNSRNAKFIGYLPGTLEIEDFLSKKDDKFYYRFSLSKPSVVKSQLNDSDKAILFTIYNSEGDKIDSGWSSHSKNPIDIRLYPGDYILKIQANQGFITYFVASLYGDPISK